MGDLTPLGLLGENDRAVIAGLAVPHEAPFVASLKVDASQLSRLVPHVNNVEYLRWIDRVAELHADSLGHTREALLREERCFFVARHELDYLAECWESERLLVVTWVRSMRKTTSWRDTLIARPEENGGSTLIARASTLWAFVDMASRRPSRIPPALVESFQPLQKDEPVRAPR
jgi:acyl-CoA thioester hydrolase